MVDNNKTQYPKMQLELVRLGNEFNLKNGGTGLNLYVKNHSLPHDDPLYGKELKMTVFDTQLKSYFETQPAGALLFADYTEEMKLDWLTPSYTITQVYVNGKPVKQKRSGGMSTEVAQIIADAINNLAEAIREFKPVSENPPETARKTTYRFPARQA